MGREDELAQRIAVINRTGNRLIDLVKVEFPRTIDRDAPAYRVALHGLVARTTGTMEAILHLAELRRADRAARADSDLAVDEQASAQYRNCLVALYIIQTQTGAHDPLRCPHEEEREQIRKSRSLRVK